MSTWTELACLLASIFLVSSIGVCLEVFPNVFCQSVWRDHLMSSWINPMSFLPVSVWWVWSVSVRAGSHLSLSANVYYEEPADVSLDWTRVSSCRCLSSEFNQCLPEVFPNVCRQICLKGSLDVFLDQPNVFLSSVCLMGLISVCPSWFSPVSFCQCLLWGTCWCLSGLNSRVFLPISF